MSGLLIQASLLNHTTPPSLQHFLPIRESLSKLQRYPYTHTTKKAKTMDFFKLYYQEGPDS